MLDLDAIKLRIESLINKNFNFPSLKHKNLKMTRYKSKKNQLYQVQVNTMSETVAKLIAQ